MTAPLEIHQSEWLSQLLDANGDLVDENERLRTMLGEAAHALAAQDPYAELVVRIAEVLANG